VTCCPACWSRSPERSFPAGQVLVGTHVGDGDVVRTEAYGGVPVTWTTHLWQPEQLAVLFAEAGLEPVAELRLSADPSGRAQVLLAARRSPLAARADVGCRD